jgi:hypothetical protein
MLISSIHCAFLVVVVEEGTPREHALPEKRKQEFNNDAQKADEAFKL